MNSFRLKTDMRLGAADYSSFSSSAETNWTRWYDRGRIRDGTDPSLGTGRIEHRRADIVMLKRLGITTCMVTAEWSCIEPDAEVFDDDAIDQLREELILMRALGIDPILVIQRFTIPAWFDRFGGWAADENIRFFLHYTEVLVRSVGHLVSEYITFDEPNFYAVMGWRAGLWPPGIKNAQQCSNVLSVLATAHIQAYSLIHDVRRFLGFEDTKVSFSLRMEAFDPLNSRNPLHRTAAALSERMFMLDPFRAMAFGKFSGSLKNREKAQNGLFCDFIGMSYYSRVSVTPSGPAVRDRAPKDDIGQEIYPQGIVRCAQKLSELCPLPIYITGSGACDALDSFRSRYIYEHLGALCLSSLPVERFYYRSFIDCFEDIHGLKARFGLVGIDPVTFERTVKSCAGFYSRIIAEGGVSDALYDEFAAGQCYHYMTVRQISEIRKKQENKESRKNKE